MDASSGSAPRLVAVNFFDESESNTQRERTLSLELKETSVEESAETNDVIVRACALIALLLLLLDLTFSAVKRVKRVQGTV